MTKTYGASIAERRARRDEENPDVPVTIEGEQVLLKGTILYSHWQEIEEITGATETEHFWSRLEDAFFSLLAGPDDAVARLRQKMRDTYTAEDIMDLLREVIQDVVARPTQAQSSSPGSPATNGTPSTATSSSTPDAASTG